MSTSVQLLEPDTRARVEEWLENLREERIPFRVTSTRRSRAEQRRLYEKFRRGESALPAARPGTSTHETGEAIDIVFESDGELRAAVDAAEDAGLRWGGETDPVHFENENAQGPFGRTAEALRPAAEEITRSQEPMTLSLARKALCRLGFTSQC